MQSTFSKNKQISCLTKNFPDMQKNTIIYDEILFLCFVQFFNPGICVSWLVSSIIPIFISDWTIFKHPIQSIEEKLYIGRLCELMPGRFTVDQINVFTFDNLTQLQRLIRVYFLERKIKMLFGDNVIYSLCNITCSSFVLILSILPDHLIHVIF